MEVSIPPMFRERYLEERRGRCLLHALRSISVRSRFPAARIFRLLPVALLVAVLLAGTASAACTPFDQSHGAWSRILGRWVKDGRVDYRGMKKEGGGELNAYLATLSGVCASDYVKWSREERIAFWINAYNAFTVRLILDHYPVSSIRSIGWLPGSAFRRAFIPMEGLKGGLISLNDIEHNTLRADFNEQRIHFALVCAAVSCPPLRGEAYRASDLDRQLNDQGRAFLRNPAMNRFDPKERILYLSSIFDWFRGDFVTAAGSLPAFVYRYLDDPRLKEPGVKIEFLEYNWSLNEKGEH